MLEILLNTDSQIIKWFSFSVALAIFAVLYFNLYLKKHLKLEKALIQVAPLFLALYLNLYVQHLNTQLKDYSQTQLSGLIINYNLRLYKFDEKEPKKFSKDNEVGLIDCKGLTFKECVLKVKNNQIEIVNKI